MSHSGLGLFFLDDEVAAALQLARRLLQPQSNDIPHITVRHSDVAVPLRFEAEIADPEGGDLVIEAPGTFDPDGFESQELTTLFLQCRSSKLEAISYKPDFPDSVFHITLYQGRASAEAFWALEMLRKFKWNLRYSPYHARILSFDHVRQARAQLNNADASVMTRAAELFEHVADQPLTIGLLQRTPFQTRLEWMKSLVEIIHSSDSVTPKPHGARRRSIDESLVFHHVYQPELFGNAELGLAAAPFLAPAEETATVITPPEIASEVSNFALMCLDPSVTEVAFLDPAIGGGVFYAALMSNLQRMADRSLNLGSAIGVERRVARANLTRDSFDGSNLKVLAGDFLSLQPDLRIAGEKSIAANLLLANPPYMRPSKDMASGYSFARKIIGERLGVKVSKRANSYIYFMLYADGFLADRGIASWVLPREVLYSDLAEPLRAYLVNQVELIAVHEFTDSMRFHRRRVSTVVITYRKSSPHKPEGVHWSVGDSLQFPDEEWNVDRGLLSVEPKWNVARDLQATGDHRRPGGHGVELGSLFQVTRGIATGGNDVFVVSDELRAKLGLERQFLRPLLPKPRELRGSRVEGDANGLPIGSVLRYLIDSKIPLDHLREQAPNLFDYLVKHSFVSQRTLPSRRNPYYRQERQTTPPMVFVAMTGKDRGGNRFILNESEGVALNNYHVVRPLPHFVDWMQKTGTDLRDVHAALLKVKPAELVSIGRVFHLGSVKLEPGDLRRLRLVGDIFESAYNFSLERGIHAKGWG